MADTFCPIPWIFQAARANGDIRVCCQANVTRNKGVIRRPDGTAFNAGKDDLNESRNAELMKSMRLNMLAGVWSDECGRCKQEEENGLVSRRSYENEQWRYSSAQARNETAQDGSIDLDKTPVRYYDLRFGNFCNLKCRMCGPTDSDSWYADWIKLTGSNVYEDTSGPVVIKEVNGKFHTGEYDWPKHEPFWEQLERNISNIEHVYFAGGEPLIIERHYDFLERCVNQDAAKNIIVEYNTNMSTIPNRALNLWKQFKQVRIGASVDGKETMLEYQRYPAKWEKVLKNLQTVDALPSNIFAWMAFTVTAYNVNHMIDFMKWKLQESGFKKINSSNRRPIITHHVAHHPKHLNIRVLPDSYKLLVTENFYKFLNWIDDQKFNEHVQKQARDIVKGVTGYMNSDSYYEEYWKEFKEYTFKLDSIRGESILLAEPRLGEYLDS
jgi:hypothetical protein